MNYQTNHLTEEVSISLDGSMENIDEDFMNKLLSSSKTINIALIVSRDAVFKSIGITYVMSGIISAIDVARVLSTSIPKMGHESLCILASTNINYLIDGTLHTELMPIGLCGRKLEAQVELVHVNKDLLSLLNARSSAVGKSIVGWRVELRKN